MANEINQVKVGSTTYTLQDSRVDDLVTGVSSVNSKTGAVSLGASDVGALSLDGGTINKSKTVKMDASANSNGANLKWGTVNSKNPYIGYASDQTDGTFVIGSLLGTNYASGLAIGGGSGNLLWKGTKVATTSDIPSVPTVNNGTLTIQKNGTSVGTFTANQSGNTTANITVPTTASDVGAAPSASGTYFVNGTQTASTNAWTGTLTGITPYDGLAIRYYLPYAGTSTGATLALNGGTAYPVYRLGTTTQITTHFGAGSVIAMTFRTSYNVAGTTKTNAWICEAFYDSNTNTQVRVYRQDASSYNKDYPLIASRTVAADLGTVGTEGSYESVYGLISDTAANIPTTNPYTGESKFKKVTATTFAGGTATTSAAGLMSAADKTKLDSTFGANAITDFNMSSGTTTAAEINTNGIKCATDELEIEFNGGTDYNYCVGNFTVPIVAGSNIAITKNDNGMAGIYYYCGTWSSGTSGTVKLPSAGTYQVRYGNSYTSVLWWNGSSAAQSSLIRINAIGTTYRFAVAMSGTLTLKEGTMTTGTETNSTATIYYRRIGD